LKILCLPIPISNGEVERVFSQVSLQKNSVRSKMKNELLESILRCKFGLSKYDIHIYLSVFRGISDLPKNAVNYFLEFSFRLREVLEE